MFATCCRNQAELNASDLAGTFELAALGLALVTTVVAILAVCARNGLASYHRTLRNGAPGPQLTPVEESPDYRYVRHFLLRGDLPAAARAYQALTGAAGADAREAVEALDRRLSPQRYREPGADRPVISQ